MQSTFVLDTFSEETFDGEICKKFEFPLEMHLDDDHYEIIGRIFSTSNTGSHYQCGVKSTFPTKGYYFYDSLLHKGYARVLEGHNRLTSQHENGVAAFYLRLPAPGNKENKAYKKGENLIDKKQLF